jgi:membrane protein implicated in regulation of membrane protease activity
MDMDVDHGDGVDFHADGADVHADGEATGDHADAGMKLLTFQGLMAFFMMFGLMGLWGMRGGMIGATLSFITAVATGVGSAWLIALLTRFMMRMQSSGTLDIYNALGQEGSVYLTIPAEGEGKVQVTIQDRLMVMDAASGDKEELKTGERIRVIGISGTSILVVERL